MWFDQFPSGSSWARLWYGYVRCGHCSGIRKSDRPCSACGSGPPPPSSHWIRLPDGSEREVRQAVCAGAEARYEDWVYLIMLEREWKRALVDEDRFLDIAATSRPAPRATLILLFWSYFETRIDRLFEEALRGAGPGIRQDLLRRYSSIGARLDRLYKVVFQTTYWADLEDCGFRNVADVLMRVQERRNEFVHGNPAAIDEQVIHDLVAVLQDEHESWIAVFNKRAAKTP
jgi:hypothetical protein